MAQIHKLEVETEVKCSADRFYGLFKNNVTQISNYLPQSIKSVQVLEGDGKSVGSVRLWKYVLGSTPNHVAMGKERVKAVDDESRSMTYSMMEGDVFNFYKSFEYKFCATPTNGDGNSCLVKWYAEFEKQNEGIPNPDLYLDFAVGISKELARHLLN